MLVSNPSGLSGKHRFGCFTGRNGCFQDIIVIGRLVRTYISHLSVTKSVLIRSVSRCHFRFESLIKHLPLSFPYSLTNYPISCFWILVQKKPRVTTPQLTSSPISLRTLERSGNDPGLEFRRERLGRAFSQPASGYSWCWMGPLSL